jgi:hypothetical protein
LLACCIDALRQWYVIWQIIDVPLQATRLLRSSETYDLTIGVFEHRAVTAKQLRKQYSAPVSLREASIPCGRSLLGSEI